MQLGDGTVITASAVSPGIKWAWEFDNKKNNGKPINFVENCSTYKRRTSVYDDDKKADGSEGERKVLKNAYFGINCDCIGIEILKKSGIDCAHT